MNSWMLHSIVLVAMMVGCPLRGLPDERHQSFDTDPGWDGHNNRSTAFDVQTIEQNFGYSPTHHAGGKAAGEMGGLINPAAEAAYYAKKLPTASVDSKLSASGTLACPGQQPFHALIAFFNSTTLNEWRTPNMIAIRIYGRGDKFYAYVEYCTNKWRAGGDSPGGFATVIEPGSTRPGLRGFKTNGAVHHWSLTYDPEGNNGQGVIVAKIDDETAICNLDVGHQADGATFDRFGILPVMKQWDQGGEVWLDDVTVNGELEDFSSDPHWDGFGNHRTYESGNVRPRFDFGFSPTNFAGGAKAGELGGLVFRGDIREPLRMAYYGDRIGLLTLDGAIKARGKITLRRAVSDSTSLLGFFNSRESVKTTVSQASAIPANFLGLAVEGPSREGFFVYPMFRNSSGSGQVAQGYDLPRIMPDGAVHEWSIEYDPQGAGGVGQLIVALDGRATSIDLADGDKQPPTEFDRFGIVTTWIDGNGQNIYFDDLTYTCRQEGR